jgi:twitching motility protein PilT
MESPSVADVQRLLQALSAESPADPAHKLRVLAFKSVAEKVADKALFAHFVKSLKGADPDLREALVELVPKVNSLLEHASLCALIRSPDPALRGAVATILTRVGAKTVFEMLSEMVQDPRFPGRVEAMRVLVGIADHRAVPALQAVLAVGSPDEKRGALDHLIDPRCMGRDPEAAVKAISTALKDPAESVVGHAIAALAQVASEDEYVFLVGAQLDSPVVTVARAAVAGLRLFPSPRVVGFLHRKLRQGPRLVRFAALDALEAIGTADVLKPLSEALGHGQVAVRVRAAEALSRLSTAGKVDLARTAVWLLRSPDVDIRRMAVALVHSVQDAEGQLWPKLLACLRDEDWWVRERVADALIDMAGPLLVPHVVGFLGEPSPLLRRFAVDVLMRLKAPEALGALVRTCRDDSDWWVRERAIEAVAALGDPRAVPYVIDLMLKSPDHQVCCIEALVDLGAKEAGPHVAGLLGAGNPDVRLAALRCLGAFDDASHTAVIRELGRDPSPAVRSLARELLAHWKVDPDTAAEAEGTSALDQLLLSMAKAGCDDLILSPDRPPFVMRLGSVQPLTKTALTVDQIGTMLGRHLSPRHREELDANREVDFSHEVKDAGLRFRVNVFKQVGGLGAVFRIIKGTIPRLETLGLPEIVEHLSELPNGLVLVGGPTGSGKSTTLAALIDRINRTRDLHVITFEDPVEAVHSFQRSLVNQREIHTHTGPLHQALRATLREDPDVILIGEMRDPATISFAVSAAETGHLVFGTIHTVSAALTVDRLINAFPAGQQEQVRSILAGNLRAVVCQYLHRRVDGRGRCLSVEVMINNEAVANLIRKGKTFQIPSVIATSREAGMQLMDGELMRLAREGRISAEDAYTKAVTKKDFEPLLGAAHGQA